MAYQRGRGGRGGRRRKVCIFCVSRGKHVIDYKDTRLMAQFIDDDGSIKKARQTGTCRRHQNRLASEIKRAREIALLPYQTSE